MGGKVLMRTCRWCEEKFNPVTDCGKECTIVRAAGAHHCEAKPRGFAAMSPEKVLRIAKQGGVAVHKTGTAHKFTTEEAVLAGKRGGRAPHVSRGPIRKTV
jgi:general stress protein YciG